MALITSAATGNFNAGATWTGGVVPGVGDEARASNGHTVTITANVTCDEVSNAGTGMFTLNDGVTLTANVTNKTTTGSRNCLQFTAVSPASASIVGNVTGGITQACGGVVNSSTGTLRITGNCVGGSGSSGSVILGCFGVNNASTGTVTVTGNCTGGSGASSHGIQNASTGSISITGNAAGGPNTGFGAYNVLSGTITITGIGTGGTVSTSSGVNNASTGTVNLQRAKGNAYGPGNTGGLAAAVGALNAGLGVIQIEELEYGEYGMSPTSGTGIRLKKAGSNVAVFNYCDTAGAKTLIDATANASMPAATDVRDGVSYASGALTGTCAVPAAGSVALGVPVDNTTGTAVLTPAAVWEYATRTITGGLVDTATTLTNAPTVPTPSQIASQVRTELSSELAKVSALNPSRLGQVTTTEILGNLLAQANS